MLIELQIWVLGWNGSWEQVLRVRLLPVSSHLQLQAPKLQENQGNSQAEEGQRN